MVPPCLLDVQPRHIVVDRCAAPGPAALGAGTWNYDNAVDALREASPNLNWSTAMQMLDHEGFSVPDGIAFEAIARMFSRAVKDKEPFPVNAVASGSAWRRLGRGGGAEVEGATRPPPRAVYRLLVVSGLRAAPQV